MPSQDRIRSEQRADFLETFATEDLACDCQSTPLVVGEQNAFLAQLLFQHLVFGPQVLDHLLLLLVDPARENDEQELPWMQNERHGGYRRPRGMIEILHHVPAAAASQ